MREQINFTDEKETAKLITFRMSQESFKKLSQVAREQGKSTSAVIRSLVKYGIQKYNENKQ